MPRRRWSSSRQSPGDAELGSLRAAAKSLALLTLVALALPAQLLVLACTRGRGSMRLPPLFHAAFAAALGVRVEYRGEALEGRGIVHACNHLSYLDVQALGRRLRTRFVAKEDVRGWPLFGLLARLQQTVFISRARHRAGEVGDALAQALAGEHGLLLFPEGTTSDGSVVLPFKSSVFAPMAARPGLRVQPVRIELLSVDGLAIAAGGERDRYAYHGSATLLPHLWRFMSGRGARLRISFLPPIVVSEGCDRKVLARAAWASVAGVAPMAEVAEATEVIA
jgi:1-acyl-sn-glycerol-3-phosphate acyltransferase